MVPARFRWHLGVRASWTLWTTASRVASPCWGRCPAAMEATGFAGRLISSLSCCVSEAGVETVATAGGVATSMILSAISASLGRSVEGLEEARTICTLAGRCWRKSSLRKAWSGVGRWSMRSCCIWRRSCVGFLSPSSSPNNCWSLRCSEAAVRLMSSAFRMLYWWSSGGLMRRSLISQGRGRQWRSQTEFVGK